MEQHKILLIIVSVSLFFAAVLGVGLWLFYPRQGAGAATAVAGKQPAPNTKEGKTGFDPIEYLRQGEQQKPPTLEQPQQKKEPGDVIIVYGNGGRSGEAGTPAQSGTPGQTGTAGAAATSGGTSTPAQQAAGTSGQAPSGTSGAAVASRPPTRSVPGLSSPERSTAAAARSAAVSAARSAARPSAAAQPRTASRTPSPARQPSHQFWIQLLASTHRDTVEAALGTLKQYSLSGHITTVSIGDKDFYRLRVGPYDSKQEAEKFQSWIRDIRDFKDAYVSEVYTN
ncbi:SPOR domain-containing protein [Salinispira pacifica]